MLNNRFAIFAGILITQVFLYSSSIYAIGLSSGSFESSCPGSNETAYLYFTGSSTQVTYPVWDDFWTPGLAFIHSDVSSVRYWQGNGGSLGANCTTQSNWFRVSNVSPGAGLHVNAIQNNSCTYTRNNNPNQPFAQFVFNVGYKNVTGFASPTSTSSYFYYLPGSVTPISLPDQTRRTWDPIDPNQAKIHSNECLTVYARWCGDGILDTTHSETCDDGNNTNGDGCSATCQTEVLPACVPGTTTGPQAAPLTAASPNLCPGAQVVSGFTGTTVGTLTNYAWACNGSAVGGACAASYNSAAVACIPGTTTGPQAAPLTAASPNLCPGAQVVSGFTGTTVGTLTNYAWACNGSAVGGACAASYNSAIVGPACTSLSASPLTGAPPLLVSFTGAGMNLGAMSTYGIAITNASGALITTLSGASASYTFNGTGTFSAQMYINTSTGGTSYTGLTSPACTLGNAISVLSSCIPGATTGNQSSPVTATTAGLCPGAQVVSGFITTVAGNTASYSWACNGSAVGGACSASFTSGGGGGASNVGKKCVNGIATCANYNSLVACIADGIPAALCYPADAVGLNSCQNQSMSCNGGITSDPSRCGDGVLNASSGEECDIAGGASWCVSCKIRGLTNPGENPITDLWMTIPVLARTQHLGYTWLDGIPGKVAFSDNRMVLGVGTKAFTLADTVGFGIKTKYRIPLVVEANKKICLKSDGSSLNSEMICTTFGTAADLDPTRIEKWQRADGVWFVNIGMGDYQKINPVPRPSIPALNDPYYAAKLQSYYDWRQYTLERSHSANNITLFKGPTQYHMPSGNMGLTLNSTFFARQVGTDGVISLVSCYLGDCSATAVVELVRLPVRVSSAVVSSIGASSNRYLENFLNPGNLFAGFLGTTNGYTSTTTSNTNSVVNHTVSLPAIVGGTTGTVRTISDIERYAVNGNTNVLAVNGDLTIENCPSNVFIMNGVRSVIVTGNIIIKCNIAYASNDTVSSWAWIAKGGNIQIFNGLGTLSTGAVSNLAGIYVAIKEGNSGGDMTYVGNNTTQTILRVEGSFYGNATPLFNSRLYARANGAYDILTTGTILSYSNRALVSPPPLLSQYLGNYQVQRVIQ